MNKKLRKSLYLLTIIAVLTMSIMPTYTVFADGGAGEDPPPADPPAEEPVEEPTVEPVIEEPTAEVPPEEAAEVSTGETPAEEPVSVPEILEQVPEGTDLVVINEEGDSEPLASEEAAEILVEGDPVWCPTGVAPGDPSCSSSHMSFDSLITDLTGGSYSGDGVIWVESSYDATQDAAGIIFDGSSGNLTNLTDVTILGGWNGVSGSKSIDPSNPSVLDDSLSIINWGGSVTVANLDFQTALSSNGSLDIETAGDITISNVNVDDNQNGQGVSLDNCLDSGAGCTATSDITVKESSFTNNDTDGLIVDSAGEVLLQDLTATGNQDDGIDMNGSANVDNNITINNVNASGNTDDGLDVDDVGGDLIIKDSSASNNLNDGMDIDDTDGNIKISNTTVSDNDSDGMEVDDTVGNVNIRNVTAENNSSDGVDIDNTNGSVYISKTTASDNGDYGFEIDYADGLTKLYCVNANNNTEDGINVDTNGELIIKCSTVKDNGDDGIDIGFAPEADLLSVTISGSGDLDIEYDALVTTVNIKKINCKPKKNTGSSEKELYTKLYCLPGEIKVALYDTYGDKVEFANLCGYEAGVFDQDSGAYPKAIPGGGDEYIASLHDKVLESRPDLEADLEHGLPGIYAQVLDELPYTLPKDYSYSAAFFTVVLEEGLLLDPLPEESSLTIRFRVPDGLDEDETLAILWWDGAEWVDLGGEYSENGYYFQITTEETGVFVLANFEAEE